MPEPDINKLDKTIAVIEQKIDDGFKEVRATQKLMGEQNCKDHGEILEYIKAVEERKAGKWVEKVLIWTGAAVGVIIIGALMDLIINK